MMPPEWEGEGGRKAHAIQASSVLLIENSASEGLTLTIKVVVGLETRAFQDPLFYNLFPIPWTIQTSTPSVQSNPIFHMSFRCLGLQTTQGVLSSL